MHSKKSLRNSLLRQLESATAETERFKQRYYRIVGNLYVELDELDAKIDNAQLKQAPNDPKLRTNAKASEGPVCVGSPRIARAFFQPILPRTGNVPSERAKKSAEEAGLAAIQFRPEPEITPDLKQAYRRAVKILHPDLALTEKERLRRTALMAQINLAYKRGDLNAIDRIIKEYGEDPEANFGEDVASRIVKTIRRIAQLKRRIEEVDRN